MPQETELTSCPIGGLHTVNLLDEPTYQIYLTASADDKPQNEAIQAEHNLQREIGWKAQIAISGCVELADDIRLETLKTMAETLEYISNGNPQHIEGIERVIQTFAQRETSVALERLRQDFLKTQRNVLLEAQRVSLVVGQLIKKRQLGKFVNETQFWKFIEFRMSERDKWIESRRSELQHRAAFAVPASPEYFLELENL